MSHVVAICRREVLNSKSKHFCHLAARLKPLGAQRIIVKSVQNRSITFFDELSIQG